MRHGNLIPGQTNYEDIIFPDRDVEVFGELLNNETKSVLYLCVKHKILQHGPSSALRYVAVERGDSTWISYTGETLRELQNEGQHIRYLWLNNRELTIHSSNKFSKHVLERFDD
jgi:hypothetical protein